MAAFQSDSRDRRDGDRDSRANLRQRYLLLVLFFGCLILGTILYAITPFVPGVTDLGGHEVSPRQAKEALVFSLVCGIPLLALVLALLLSGIPYKHKKYKQKFPGVFLGTLAAIYLLLILLRIFYAT